MRVLPRRSRGASEEGKRGSSLYVDHFIHARPCKAIAPISTKPAPLRVYLLTRGHHAEITVLQESSSIYERSSNGLRVCIVEALLKRLSDFDATLQRSRDLYNVSVPNIGQGRNPFIL
jgi:hypothetical protein